MHEESLHIRARVDKSFSCLTDAKHNSVHSHHQFSKYPAAPDNDVCRESHELVFVTVVSTRAMTK